MRRLSSVRGEKKEIHAANQEHGDFESRYQEGGELNRGPVRPR